MAQDQNSRKNDLQEVVSTINAIALLNKNIVFEHEIVDNTSSVDIKCVVLDYDLIDADLDYDVFEYEKLVSNLCKTLMDAMTGFLSLNVSKTVVLRMYKAWMTNQMVLTESFVLKKLEEDGFIYHLEEHSKYKKMLVSPPNSKNIVNVI